MKRNKPLHSSREQKIDSANSILKKRKLGLSEAKKITETKRLTDMEWMRSNSRRRDISSRLKLLNDLTMKVKNNPKLCDVVDGVSKDMASLLREKETTEEALKELSNKVEVLKQQHVEFMNVVLKSAKGALRETPPYYPESVIATSIYQVHMLENANLTSKFSRRNARASRALAKSSEEQTVSQQVSLKNESNKE